MRTHLLLSALLAWAVNCWADLGFGDWYVGTADDGTPYMLTANDSQALFGKWCDADNESCFWMIASPTVSCEDGHQAAALLSSDLGSFNVTLTCAGTRSFQGKTYWRTMISNPDDLDSIAVKSTSFGIAIAMQDGNFRVMRFPMKGSDKAFSQWRQQLAQGWSGTKKTKQSTKDVTM